MSATLSAVITAQEREIALQPLGVVLLQVAQPIKFSGYLFALISNDGQVMLELFRFMQVSKGVEVDRHAGFHVHGAAAVQDAVAKPVRGVVRERHGVDVPREHHPARQPEVGARDDGVAEALHLRVLEPAQRLLDGVGDRLLVVRRRLDVHERCGEVDGVCEKV